VRGNFENNHSSGVFRKNLFTSNCGGCGRSVFLKEKIFPDSRHAPAACLFIGKLARAKQVLKAIEFYYIGGIQMKQSVSYRIVTAGLLVALGLILPYCTSHMFAIPGTLLLPMHIPILLCGLLCGPKYGALCGVLVPVLSSLFTGMPPSYPMLPIMTAQLLTLGLVSGLLYWGLRLPIYPAILGSMISGWTLYGAVFAVLLFDNESLQALTVTAAIVTGIPGMITQLVLCPVLVTALHRYVGVQNFLKQIGDHVLEDARAMIKKSNISCVVIRDNTIVHTADGRGISPLLALYINEPQMLRDAIVVDKIIGKAAAVILILGGAKFVFGEIMSRAAKKYLVRYEIKAQYGRCVDMITAIGGKGICPIEKSVLDIDKPSECFVSLNKKATEMQNAV